MYSPKRYFIFDLDGTLANTISDITAGLNLTMLQLGFPTFGDEKTLQNINRGARELVRGCIPKRYYDDEAFVSRVLKMYTENYSKVYLQSTSLYPSVLEGIRYLRENGAMLAVYSNKQDLQVKEICAKLFPKNTFAVTLGYSGEFPHKPCPDGALYIASLFGAEPFETVIVGDSDIDMRLADNAGMHKVGVGWGYRSGELLLSCGAEMIINGFEDFKSLI